MHTMDYDLELKRVEKLIKENDARLVCVQLPDGLKPKADEIVDHIHKNTKAKAVIWMGSCYGACDVPLEVKRIGADLIIQWGHSGWP